MQHREVTFNWNLKKKGFGRYYREVGAGSLPKVSSASDFSPSFSVIPQPTQVYSSKDPGSGLGSGRSNSMYAQKSSVK